MTDLKTTQELFWQLTQAPEGVERQWAALAPDRKGSMKELKDFLVEDEPGEAEERMEVYAQMYFWRLFESLEEDFPATESILGREAFHRLIVDYLQAFPSRFRDIAEVGTHLPDFLKDPSLVVAQSRPYLSDLARWEWAQIEVAREEDAAPLRLTELQKIPPQHWGELRLRLIPASRLLISQWDILSPWKKHVLEKNSLQGYQVLSHETNLLVWRKPNHDLRILELKSDAAELFLLLKKGCEFQHLCQILSQHHPDDAVALATRYLLQWLEEECLTLCH